MRLTLARIAQDGFATYGRLCDEENKELCVTLERPWLGNAHNVSCIPAGAYAAHRFRSPHRGYDVFELAGVTGRGNIELHTGNLPKDSEGCILLGTSFGLFGSQRGIVSSRDAFARFMDHMRGVDTFTLVVTEATA